MGPADPAPGREDSVARLAWVDGVCDRFEAAWRAGAGPSAAAFLRAEGVDPAALPDLVRELARVEAEYRRAVDDTPPDPEAAHHPTRSAGPPPGGAAAGVPDVPGYVVGGELGRGGMGVVWAATDPVLGREVAVKVLHPDGPGGRGGVDRFVREARITAALPHPGIPPVHALGALPDGRPFLAMKLVRGRTLAALLEGRGGPGADLPGLVRVFEQVCQAVAFAHSRGFVHRDLKPANVMVGDFGEVMVMDWGLAKEPGAAPADGGGRAGSTRRPPSRPGPGRSSGRPRTCPRSRPAGRSTRSTGGATCSASGPSSAASSPAGRRSPGSPPGR